MKRSFVLRSARRWLALTCLTMATLASAGLLFPRPPAPLPGIGYGVDSTGDGDNTGSSNFCDDGTGHCTLRAAIQAANGHPGADFIGFNIPASDPGCDAAGNCTVNLPRALPDVIEGVSIGGPGASHLTVRRNSGAAYRIFTVTAATGTVTLSGMTISNGSQVNGGGILNQNGGTVSVTNCIISLNSAGGNGGGIYNFHTGTVNITNSTLTGNNAEEGAALANGRDPSDTGTVNITNSTLSDNFSSSVGGAIYQGGLGSLNITGSTVSGNREEGIYMNQGVGNITNSTISGNFANDAGGGILNNIGTMNITNSTISGNIARATTGDSFGGGISNNTMNGGTVNVRSTIIAGNTGTLSPDVDGPFATAGFNLIGAADGSTGFTALSDQKGTLASPLDPKLNPAGLQNNGGPTKTIALLFGSPAIDKGTSNGLTGQLTTDQRGAGFPRTFNDPGIGSAFGGDDTDIGAFEVQTAAPTVLANISTRLRVETGDNIPIAGFIVTGTQAKKVIVRALGPSLNVMGVPVPGRVPDTTLELRGPGGLISSNDNWRTTQEAEIIASTVPPPNDLESAIVATLPANTSAYTATMRGAGNTTGVGQVEVYDLDRTVDSQLANISTRGFVQTGDNVMIGGIIVVGSSPRRVIVRAIGPSLAVMGTPVPGRMADPTLEIRDANGMLEGMNDNWRSTQEAEIIATTVPPTNDLESAIVVTLPANAGGTAHTAIVKGKNNTTGVALVEVFALN